MTDSQAADIERARILGETAKIPFSELQRWCASGMAIYVAPDLDLVETAYQLSRGNASQLAQWLDSGAVDRVSDAQAADWIATDALVWAVVVKPWVLVQPVQPEATH